MKKTKQTWLLGACVALALLTGCAQAPKKQAFNAAAAGHIKAVLVTQNPNQESYDVAILAHPGMSFGLIGGLVAAADMQSKSAKLTAAIDVGETRLQERFSAQLTQKLGDLGYATSITMLPKELRDEEVLGQAKAQGKGDAVMAVRLTGGYWAAGPSSDYFPRLVANVRTFDAQSGATLYEDTFTYGYAVPNAPTIHMASDPQYRFANIDALVADPVKTRQGLLAGLEAIAAQVAQDLKRP